jgi:hypothetical protein|uniref:Ubiquitin-like protease family profile domain-containing protein n=1 Tax=viral metagenome TaxID=1070528 RepID=A0A6C0IW71_9ZZZZ
MEKKIETTDDESEEITDDESEEITDGSIGPLPLPIKKIDISCECKPAVELNKYGTCIPEQAIKKIAKKIGISEKAPKKVFKEIKEKTGCDGESCVLTKPEASHVISDSEIIHIKETHLKAYGPRDTRWFSNFDHHTKLLELAEKYQSLAVFRFAMSNVLEWGPEDNHPICKLDVRALRKSGKKYIAIPLNTDTYRVFRPDERVGKHWVCIFCDMSKKHRWTVEYFNSSGKPISAETGIRNIAIYLKDKFDTYCKKHKPDTYCEFIELCSTRQQYSKSECGGYILYILNARVQKPEIKPEEYKNYRIPDDAITIYRQVLFREYE